MQPQQLPARRVLVQLSVTPEFRQFALPELKAMLRRTGLPMEELFRLEFPEQSYPKQEHQVTADSLSHYPFLILNVPDYEKHEKYLQEAAKNSVMVSKIVLLIAEGATYDDLIKDADEEVLQRYARNPATLVHCDFSSRNRTINREEQVPRIHQVLGNLRVLGKVHANAPERIFDLIEDHRWFEGHHRDPSESTLRRVYFGVELSNFRDLKNRKFNLKFELPQRIYLGPTSTDNDLAFLMIHQCQIEAGDFVLDPFVGTGSLLIPAAYYGAHTFGSDLDIRVLNGYSVGKINKRAKYYDKDKGFELFTPKIMLPFRQYGLSEPEIFRMDCLHSRFLQREFFDAIVCDPPYGIRAMSRSTNKQVMKPISQQQPSANELKVQPPETKVQQQPLSKQPETEPEQLQEVPDNPSERTDEEKKRWKKDLRRRNKQQRKANQSKEEVDEKVRLNNLLTAEKNEKWENARIEVTSRQSIYEGIRQNYVGLLNYAAEYLRPGRNLVFLYPIMEDEGFKGTAAELPSHPSFELLDFGVNKIAKGNIRVLVTMRKLTKLS